MSELIYGRRAVLETLRATRRQMIRLWLEGDEGQQLKGSLVDIHTAAIDRKIPVRFVRDGLFAKFAQQGINAQGVAFEVGSYPYAELDDCLALAQTQEESPLLVLLDHLEDPQNLGSLIRSAEVFGAHGLIIPDRRSASVTPAVSNASAGAVEHLLVVQVTNLNRLIDELKKANIWVVGLDGSPETLPLDRSAVSGSLAIVVGSEGKGLSRLTRDKCDFLVRLPMQGQIESLNAAVAGSIVLYAAREARNTSSIT